jgi:hypothetical protein
MTDTDINLLIDRLTVRQQREFALWSAERVRHLMTDPRSTNALDVTARHLRGEATDEELAAARTAAARAAEGDAARAAEWAAAWAAARASCVRRAIRASTRRSAARAAAWWAAWAAEGDAARAAERAAQFAELNRLLEETK